MGDTWQVRKAPEKLLAGETTAGRGGEGGKERKEERDELVTRQR